LYWLLLIILLLLPILVDFVFIYDIRSFLQRIFPFWVYATPAVIFKDILFIEGAILLIFGALIGGVTLYTAWTPTDVRKTQFTEYIWNWKKIKEERNFPTGLIVGLTLIVFGIIYFLIAIFFPSYPVGIL
jgi:hypothetical protein